MDWESPETTECSAEGACLIWDQEAAGSIPAIQILEQCAHDALDSFRAYARLLGGGAGDAGSG